MTLAELLIATVITSMIGLAIASMMAAVSNGVTVRRDSRTHVLRGHAAHTRLGAYVTDSNCVLDHADDVLTIWLDDSRASGNRPRFGTALGLNTTPMHR